MLDSWLGRADRAVGRKNGRVGSTKHTDLVKSVRSLGKTHTFKDRPPQASNNKIRSAICRSQFYSLTWHRGVVVVVVVDEALFAPEGSNLPPLVVR